MYKKLLKIYDNPKHNTREKEKRITDKDWSNYDFTHAVFKPKLMTPEELKQGLGWAYKRIYSIPSILKRVSGSFFSRRRWKYSWAILALNIGYRRTFKGDKKLAKSSIKY